MMPRFDKENDHHYAKFGSWFFSHHKWISYIIMTIIIYEIEENIQDHWAWLQALLIWMLNIFEWIKCRPATTCYWISVKQISSVYKPARVPSEDFISVMVSYDRIVHAWCLFYLKWFVILRTIWSIN